MAERLTNLEFARMALGSMPEADRIAACREALQSVADPDAHDALRQIEHETGRRADELEREQRRGRAEGFAARLTDDTDLKALIGDIVGAACLFGTGYLLLVGAWVLT